MDPLLSLRSAHLSMDISAELSGRVAKLSFRGKNLLSTANSHPDNWGATYWTSPQSDWGWPPLPEVDGAPYRVLSKGDVLHLMGPPAQLGERLFRIEKRFQEGEHPGTIDTYYEIVNTGSSEFSMANWEISRFPSGGLTFYPTGEKESSPVSPHHLLPLLKEGGTSFYDHRHFKIGKCLKLHADGQGGYLAHACGRALILKIFADCKPEHQAPGEGECEIFANDDGKYVEVEVQGPYAKIAPGKSSTLKIRTVVCDIPRDITQDSRAALRAFADEMVQEFS